MVNFLLWLIFGALAGWLVGIITQADPAQGLRTSMVVGVVGAILGGLSWNNLLALIGSESSALHMSSLLVAFVGAIILTGVVNLMQLPDQAAPAGDLGSD